MTTNAANDAGAPGAGLLTIRRLQIDVACASARRSAEDAYRRAAVSAVANEPRDGVSVAASLVEASVQATVADHFFEPIAAFCCLEALLSAGSRQKVEAKIRGELAYLRQRLDRLEAALPARIEAETVAAMRALGR